MTILNKILFTFYFLLFTLFSIYSYAFLDIGLTLTSSEPFLNFQKKMRWFGYFNRPQSTLVFIVLSCLLFIVYYLLLRVFRRGGISLKNFIVLSFLSCLVLVFSYPAFSSDIFNYIFNAKMVLVYHANPHYHSAWEFSDPMLGFMRNIHTPAPYFYGWTIISFIPWFSGLNRIFPEMIAFKLFSTLFLYLIFYILTKIYLLLKINFAQLRLVLLLLNPFILIEAIGMGHNDLSMMFFILLSFYFLIQFKQQRKIKLLTFFIFFFLFSVSIKYATIVLLPVFIIWYFNEKFDFGLWGAILLFLLPFTRPIDQLHSWYLIWPLVWILICKNFKYINFIYFLSFFAFLRYTSFIWFGNWNPPVAMQRVFLYFFIPVLSLPFFMLKRD